MKTIFEVGDLLAVIHDQGIYMIQASFAANEVVNGYMVGTTTDQYVVPLNIWLMASIYLKPGIDDTEDQARSALALNNQGVAFLEHRERKNARPSL